MRSCTWVLLSNSNTPHCFYQRLIILDNIWLIMFSVLREKLSIKKAKGLCNNLALCAVSHDDSQNQSTMACTITVPISFKIGISSLFELWFEFGWSHIIILQFWKFWKFFLATSFQKEGSGCRLDKICKYHNTLSCIKSTNKRHNISTANVKPRQTPQGFLTWERQKPHMS